MSTALSGNGAESSAIGSSTPRQAIEEIPQFVRGIPFAFRRLRSYDDSELRRPTSPGYDQFAGGMEIEAKATTEKREAELASKRLHVSILRKASI